MRRAPRLAGLALAALALAAAACASAPAPRPDAPATDVPAPAEARAPAAARPAAPPRPVAAPAWHEAFAGCTVRRERAGAALSFTCGELFGSYAEEALPPALMAQRMRAAIANAARTEDLELELGGERVAAQRWILEAPDRRTVMLVVHRAVRGPRGRQVTRALVCGGTHAREPDLTACLPRLAHLLAHGDRFAPVPGQSDEMTLLVPIRRR